ncbi:MAG: flagellar protein FlgN [Woeseia sp.]
MPSTATQLETIIEGGIDGTSRLVAILGRERAALEAQDAGLLLELAAEKQGCLSELEELETQRTGLLQQHNFSNDNAGMQSLLAGTRSADDWQRYLDLAARCQAENQTNGAIIRLRHQQISATLAVVSGERQSTYGPSGDRPAAQSRALAQA